MTGRGVAIPTLISSLSALTSRLVLDRSGLTGQFDLEMTFARDQNPSANAAAAAPPASDSPSLFTALQEQLGLKLGSIKAPMDVLVIDHVEHPTED
jgi:uncharacterized protein (TIGR03435 family)